MIVDGFCELEGVEVVLIFYLVFFDDLVEFVLGGEVYG